MALGAFEGAPSIPAVALMARELTLVGSMCYAHDRRVGDFARALEVLSRHRDVLGELITHRFSLDQVRQAFDAAADKRAGAIKVLVMPGGA